MCSHVWKCYLSTWFLVWLGIKLKAWSLFSTIWKALFHWSLVSSVAIEKPEVSLISDPLDEPPSCLSFSLTVVGASLSLIFMMMCFSLNLFSCIVWVPGEPFQPVNSFNPSVLEHFLTYIIENFSLQFFCTHFLEVLSLDVTLLYGYAIFPYFSFSIFPLTILLLVEISILSFNPYIEVLVSVGMMCMCIYRHMWCL